MAHVTSISYTQDYAAGIAVLVTQEQTALSREHVVVHRETVEYSGEDVMEESEKIFRSLCKTYPRAVVHFRRIGNYEIDKTALGLSFLSPDWAYIPQKERS